MSQEKTVLEEATRLTAEDRQAVYGHPKEDFARAVGMFNALFASKLKEPLTIEEWPMVHVITKLARLFKRKYHKDSWTDVAGYARTAEMIQEETK